MTTEWFREGDIVRDTTRSQVGEVRAVNGDRLEVVRPSGLMWETSKYNCRNASQQDVRQLETNRLLRLKDALSSQKPSPS